MTTSNPKTLQQDLLHCRGVIAVHSKSFHAASKLLPGDMRDAAVATYAFCRGADDDVDDAASLEDARARHAATRERLLATYQGTPPATPVGRAFAWVVKRYAIPLQEPLELLKGMHQDLEPMLVPGEDELLAYCYRAAGVVGLMMSRIMGCSQPQALQRAVDLGMAMQLTNIARDVGEDALRGRVYLPQTWLQEAGTSQAQVLLGRHTPEIAACNRRVLRLAETYYQSGMDGIALLPWGCRPAILAAALIYREIGVQVLQRGGDGMTARARVSGLRKVWLALVSVMACVGSPRFWWRRVAPHQDALHAALHRLQLMP